MKWHDGDNWRLTIRGVQSDKPFLYKYVVIDLN